MSLPLAWEEDRKALLTIFRARAEELGPLQQNRPFPIHIFEWQHGEPKGKREIKHSVDDLTELGNAAIRVIFAYRDTPHPDYVNSLTRMFEVCDIPSAFISESLQNVSQSFGTQTDDNGSSHVWFHFLSKDIQTVKVDGQPCVVHPETVLQAGDINDTLQESQAERDRQARNQHQANFIWHKTGIVLRVEKHEKLSPAQSRSTSNNTSSSSLTVAPCKPEVTLFCFGAPESIGSRFERLRDNTNCAELLKDRYMFVHVIIEEMYKLLDDAGWSVSRAFGPIETKTLQGAQDNVVEAGRKVNFTGLHNLAKHAIYLSENCDSALATLQCFRDFHETTFECSLDPSQKCIPNSSQKAMRQALNYHKTLFESTKRRLSSLEKRMTNILELSFHLVTLRDSRTMQSESKSMKTIAIMTLFFMPLGTIAAVFGTEFFNTRDDDPVHIRVSQDFWILWLIVGPLTIFVVAVWLVWYWDARAKLGFDVWQKGESVYLGWKWLKRRFRYQGFQIKGRSMQDDEGIEMRSMS